MRGFHRDCVVYVGNEPLLVQLLVYAHLTGGWRDPARVPLKASVPLRPAALHPHRTA
jgi:hypothetical protein